MQHVTDLQAGASIERCSASHTRRRLQLVLYSLFLRDESNGRICEQFGNSIRGRLVGRISGPKAAAHRVNFVIGCSKYVGT
jgi:hypothetical protein